MASDPKRNLQDISISPLPDPCEDAGSLIAKAKRCRRLAAGISDAQTSEILRNMAINYEDAAQRLTQEG